MLIIPLENSPWENKENKTEEYPFLQGIKDLLKTPNGGEENNIEDEEGPVEEGKFRVFLEAEILCQPRTKCMKPF